MNDHRLHQLDDYLSDSLSTSDVAGVENHLKLCDSCRAEFERGQRLLRATDGLPRSIRPQRDLWNGIAKRLTAHRTEVHTLEDPSHQRPRILSRSGMAKWIRYGTAAAAMIGIASVGIWWLFLQPQSGWNFAVLKGTVSLGSRVVSGEARISVGDLLQTDDASSAKIQVGMIGHVDVAPNTSIRLVQAALTDHRLALEKGTITATIVAPPRLFFVETPSALAVDLGCAYTLSVDDAGAGILRVTSGWVALEFDDRESIVPAGAVCTTRPGFGPGTPHLEDASDALTQALTAYDFENGGREKLRIVLGEARNMDSITLWHLYIRTSGVDRAAVYDRLSSLVRPPRGVTRDGMLAGNPEMIKVWRKHLNLGMDGWWRVL